MEMVQMMIMIVFRMAAIVAFFAPTIMHAYTSAAPLTALLTEEYCHNPFVDAKFIIFSPI